MTRRPPRRSPISTGFGTTVPSAATVMHDMLGLIRQTARRAPSGPAQEAPTARRSRANAPGVSNRSGLGTVARAWMVPLERFERVVDEIQRALPGEAVLVAKADRHLVGCPDAWMRAAGRRQVIGLAHVEIEIDRIERNQRRE